LEEFPTTETLKRKVYELALQLCVSLTDEFINPYIYSVRLVISEKCFVQLYFNVEKRKFLMAVVKDGSRIYGFDKLDEECHEHPEENPKKHIIKPCSEVNLDRFLDKAITLCKGESHG